MNRMYRMLLAWFAAGSLLAISNLAHAAGHGGGGGHGGGAGHMGAFHGGGFHHGGGFGRGFYGGYPYYGFGLGLGLGYGLGYGYGYGYGYGPYGYGYGPYGYGGYGYPNYGIPYGAAYPPAYYPNTPTYNPGPVTPPANGTNSPTTPATPGSTPAPAMLPPLPIQHLDTEVTLIVRIPADAILWVNGAKTTQSGTRREFTSRGLEPGRTYTFHLRAQWTDPNGATLDHDRSLTVQAGERRALDFATLPALPGDVVTAPVLPLPGTPTMAVPRANP